MDAITRNTLLILFYDHSRHYTAVVIKQNLTLLETMK